MYRGRRVSAVIVAAGSSTRMGFDKLLVKLDGVEVLRHTLARFEGHPYIDSIVVVAGGNLSAVQALVAGAATEKPVTVVPGGATRTDSVASGVIACGDASLVAIHDGARPFVSAALITRAVEAAADCGAAAPAIPVKDTIKRVRGDIVEETLPREALRAVQTPQVFDRASFARALAGIPPDSRAAYTDDCMVMERAGVPVRLVEGDERNTKITTREDLALLEAMLTGREAAPTTVEAPVAQSMPPAAGGHVRIGHGYDVHKLVPGRPLVLGGVTVPFHLGLLGHSDADVLAHAVADALLGAAALGDIGRHFPDSDARYKNADSLQLLARVADIVREAGFTVGNVDATLLCQAPKLAGHIGQMRENLAEALGCGTSAVSVKATTEEGLGFTGSLQGIAAHCIVSLLPQ